MLVIADRLSKMCPLEACTKTITSEGVARVIGDFSPQANDSRKVSQLGLARAQDPSRGE
jgi:hypothetical protein